MRAEIIAVGSELLTPWRMDTNSLFISDELSRIGIRVWKKTIVGDRVEDLREVFAAAIGKSDIVISIGGLGPTNDDLTREVIADVTGRKLELRSDALEHLKKRFARIGVVMTPNNRQQAMAPEGAQILANANGTAPGLFLTENDCLVFLLPGPPHELKPLMTGQVIPAIAERRPTERLIYRHLRIASEGESKVDYLAAPIYQSYPAVETTILAAAGIVDLYFYWHGSPDAAEPTLAELAGRVREALGASVFAEQDAALEAVVGELLRQRGKTLATAESCTGGMIAKLLTDIPGSSDYYLGGAIAYSNEIKAGWLDVDREVLKSAGAVSPEVAVALARAVREKTGADFGLSSTGVAGPGGGSEQKPVGLVYLGLADHSGTEARKLTLPGNRETVRLRASRTALDWLRRKLL